MIAAYDVLQDIRPSGLLTPAIFEASFQFLEQKIPDLSREFVLLLAHGQQDLFAALFRLLPCKVQFPVEAGVLLLKVRNAVLQAGQIIVKGIEELIAFVCLLLELLMQESSDTGWAWA